MATKRVKKARERIQKAIDQLRLAQEDAYHLMLEPIILELMNLMSEDE